MQQPRPKKKVCLQCRRAHTACDGQQPCRRCIGAGIADQCCPPPAGKPRGRSNSALTDPQGAAAAGQGAAAATAMAMSMTTGMPVNLAPQSAAAAAAAAAAFFSSSAPTNHASSMPLPAGYASAYGGSGVADYAQPAIKKHRVDGTTGTAYGMLPGLTSYPSADAGAGASGELAQIRSLLSMLLEQVRDMKRENSDLREEVLDLRVRLDDNDKEHRRQMDALRREIATVQRRRRHDTSPSSSSSLSSMNNSPTTTTNVLESALQRQAIMTTLPFLREYSEFLDTFILNDVLTEAYAVFYVGEPKSVEELSVNPPVFVHASPACCSLTGFTQEELMGKPITMLCHTEKEMIFVILTRIFSKPTKPTGEIFTTTMTWATKDNRAVVVRLRHQLFYNKQRQPKWYFVAVESVLDDDAPQPQRSVSDILHNPNELQRFKSQFSAFFNSLYTTQTVTVTTISGGPPGSSAAHAAFMGGAGGAFPPSASLSSTTFSGFPSPLLSFRPQFPHASSAMITATQHNYSNLNGGGSGSGSGGSYLQQQQHSPPQLYLSSSSTSSFDSSSSPDTNPLDSANTSSSSSLSEMFAQAQSQSTTMDSSETTASGSEQTAAWSNITLAELLEDDECRAILQEQKRKVAESQQQQPLQHQQQRVSLMSSGSGIDISLMSGGGSGGSGSSGKSLAEQSLEELLDEFVPRNVVQEPSA